MDSTHIKKQRVDIDQYNKELDASIQQIKEGKTVAHSVIVKQSEKWFKRRSITDKI